MATVNKDFRIKAGLVVEGANATVNGEDIITTGSSTDDLQEGSTNLYFTAQRAADAVADEISSAVSTAVDALTTDVIEEGTTNLYFTNERAQDAIGTAITNGTQSGITVTYDDTDGEIAFTVADQWTGKTTDDLSEGATNLYFTNQRALDATASAYDVAGAASTAQAAAESYADGVATSAENAAKLYADGLAVNYDPAGSADAAEAAANTYADGVALTAENNAKGYADTVALTAEQSAKSYADSLATNYDPAGSAQTAETNAASYTDTAIANLVDGAPALLDTLNELAAAINDDASFASTIATSIGEKVSKSGDTMTGELVLAADPTQALAAATKQYADSVASDAYNDAIATADGTAQTYANTAENNAKSYADTNFVNVADLPGQLDDYVPLTDKGTANGVATLDSNGFVPSSQLNIDVSGDISTAINALTTSDIEEGTNLYFTDERAIDAVSAADIYPNAVIVNNVSKTVANTQSVSTASTVSGITWAKADYKSAKLVVKAATATHSQVSEIMVTLDSSDNVAITEFGIVYTDTELATVTADVSGTDVRVRVTTLNASTTVTVVGTLLI
jgi:hypothetical protein